MSTGENPEDFVKSKIDNSDVSLLSIAICEMGVIFVSNACSPVLLGDGICEKLWAT